MLNLLIAIISDTFDRVNEKKVPADCLVRCELILKIERLFFWNKAEDTRKYLHFCRYKFASDFESNDENETIGMVRSIKNSVSSLTIKLDQRLKKFELRQNEGFELLADRLDSISRLIKLKHKTKSQSKF